METALLRTKLNLPPVRPALVSRPRLVEQLSTGLHRKLTLISAPAGFGKTTLVSAWLADSGYSVAWLSLDESDNDLNQFLIRVIAALQTLEPDFGHDAFGALQSPQPPQSEAILITLINEIAVLTKQIVFVLDDYHLIEAKPIHDAINFLLQHLPPQLHLVIATRADPPLSLALLRARGQLTELRALDLRFSSSHLQVMTTPGQSD